MASAGSFPIVRGSKTIDGFFDRLMAQPRPDNPLSLKTWMRSSGLKSSYFDDMFGFAEFIRLVDEAGATDLWGELRSGEAHRDRLLTALREAYRRPLEHFGLDAPNESDRTRLVDWVRTVENAEVTDADAAVDTMLRAFDRALGREHVATAQPKPERSSGRRVPAAAKTAPKTTVPASKSVPAGRVGMPVPQIAVQVNLAPGMSAEEIDNVFASMARHIYPSAN